MKTIQLQITCIISTFTNVLVVCILKFKQLLDWLVRFDRRDCMGGVAGWDRRGGTEEGDSERVCLGQGKVEGCYMEEERGGREGEHRLINYTHKLS